jgi:hypothetical protein
MDIARKVRCRKKCPFVAKEGSEIVQDCGGESTRYILGHKIISRSNSCKVSSSSGNCSYGTIVKSGPSSIRSKIKPANPPRLFIYMYSTIPDIFAAHTGAAANNVMHFHISLGTVEISKAAIRIGNAIAVRRGRQRVVPCIGQT